VGARQAGEQVQALAAGEAGQAKAAGPLGPVAGRRVGRPRLAAQPSGHWGGPADGEEEGAGGAAGGGAGLAEPSPPGYIRELQEQVMVGTPGSVLGPDLLAALDLSLLLSGRPPQLYMPPSVVGKSAHRSCLPSWHAGAHHGPAEPDAAATPARPLLPPPSTARLLPWPPS
jgi:hypothetical protein